MIKCRRSDLSTYFTSLYESCGLEPKVEGNPWLALEAAYEKPPRAYHNINHAVECAMMGEAYQLPAIGVMALLYHDACNVPGGNLNEEESIVILGEHFGECSGSAKGKLSLRLVEGPSQLEAISALIRATKHDREPSTGLEAIVMDIDMAILGSDPEKFDLYDRAIREEYDFVSKADFEVGRVKFFSDLLNKKQIFYSPLLHHRFEKEARANLRSRITRFRLEALERAERNVP
jgi:predicted metal-dependent HD superfamily phosphohydrolase